MSILEFLKLVKKNNSKVEYKLPKNYKKPENFKSRDEAIMEAPFHNCYINILRKMLEPKYSIVDIKKYELQMLRITCRRCQKDCGSTAYGIFIKVTEPSQINCEYTTREEKIVLCQNCFEELFKTYL